MQLAVPEGVGLSGTVRRPVPDGVPVREGEAVGCTVALWVKLWLSVELRLVVVEYEPEPWQEGDGVRDDVWVTVWVTVAWRVRDGVGLGVRVQEGVRKREAELDRDGVLLRRTDAVGVPRGVKVVRVGVGDGGEAVTRAVGIAVEVSVAVPLSLVVRGAVHVRVRPGDRVRVRVQLVALRLAVAVGSSERECVPLWVPGLWLTVSEREGEGTVGVVEKVEAEGL